MFFANDKNGNRISAEVAIIGEIYYCPTCNTELILKPGMERRTHFAHKTACSDKWHYEMSEWHQRMQGYFLPQYREVVVEYNGEKHTMSEWGRITGLGMETIRRRIRSGWDVEEILTVSKHSMYHSKKRAEI